MKELCKFWIGNLISDKGDWRRPLDCNESYQSVICIRWKWLNRLQSAVHMSIWISWTENRQKYKYKMANAYDHLFKLLIIGDSGEWARLLLDSFFFHFPFDFDIIDILIYFMLWHSLSTSSHSRSYQMLNSFNFPITFCEQNFCDIFQSNTLNK